MNTLERSLIEKAGNDNGWEFVRESTEQRITLASLRHECEVAITPIEKVEGEYRLVFSRHIDKIEVIRGMPEGIVLPGNTYRIWSVSLLGDFLHRVAEGGVLHHVRHEAADRRVLKGLGEVAEGHVVLGERRFGAEETHRQKDKVGLPVSFGPINFLELRPAAGTGDMYARCSLGQPRVTEFNAA